MTFSYAFTDSFTFVCGSFTQNALSMCHILRTISKHSTHGTSFLLKALAIHRVLDDIARRCPLAALSLRREPFNISGDDILSLSLFVHIMHDHTSCFSTASQAHITSYASLRSSLLIKPEQYALGLLLSLLVLPTLYSCTNFVLR